MENDSSCSARSVLNSITAGYLSGMCGVIVGHPFDSMKVILQTETGKVPVQPLVPQSKVKSPSPITPAVASRVSSIRGGVSPATPAGPAGSNMSTLAAPPATAAAVKSPLNSAPVKRSIRSLYAGIAGPLVSIGMIEAMRFSSYDCVRRVMYKRQNRDAAEDDYLNQQPLTSVTIAAGVSGGAVGIVISPFQVIKTKSQIMVWTTREAISHTLRSPGGAKNFFAGFMPHTLCEFFGRGIYFGSYEGLKREIRNYKNSDSLTMGERAVCAAVGGMVSWAMIFPADVLRSRMYAQCLDTGPQKNAWEMTRSIYVEGGNSLRPFFRGFGITILRAGPVCATVLPIYDKLLEWFNDYTE